MIGVLSDNVLINAFDLRRRNEDVYENRIEKLVGMCSVDEKRVLAVIEADDFPSEDILK